METLENDFILKFHSLEGITIAERHKNLFKLLYQNRLFKENTELLDSISAHLTPRTYLESLFKVDFLIYYRRTQELHQLLKEGNDVFVSKIAKQTWFFKESFNEIGAEELVNEILPCMSFSVRMKVLRKLSRYLNTDQFEKIFDAVVIRYGIFIASQFITGCGPTKIKQILAEYVIRLTSSQLKILHGKDPELIDYYFTHTKQQIRETAYKNLVKFISDKDCDLYNYLKGKYDICQCLGRRATKKFVSSKKDEIIKSPNDFRYLNTKSVIRKLGKDSVTFFCNWLPDNFEKHQINRLLTFFPKRYHYNLYVRTVQSQYDIKFEDNVTLIDESLLKLIPEHSERALLAKVKVDHGDDNFLKYLTINDSIRLIKEKINLTSDINERGKLVKCLIETCHINNDLAALFSVMKYFCSRHKNDELSVHFQFINNIENIFGYQKFTQEMWNCLNDLLLIHTLKYDKNLSTYQKIQTLPLISFTLGTSSYQKLSYLEFLFKKGESIDDLIKEYFSTSTEFPRYEKHDKLFFKYCMLYLAEHRQASLEESEINLSCNVITQFYIWNFYNKNDKIFFYSFPVLVDAFNHIVRNYKVRNFGQYYYVFQEFTNKIFTTEKNIYRTDYMTVYWERFDIFGDLKHLKWFLKYDPLTIVNNFDKFFVKLIDTDNKSLNYVILRLWYFIKKCGNLQLDEKSVQLCLSKLSDESCLENKSKFVGCLSILMKPEDYAALADSYKPLNKKLDLQNETEVRQYNLQCSIAKEFKNTKSFRVLPSLLNYCAGDYFKYAIRSLYALLYRTPEKMLSQYLHYLSKKAVSVRKHALFLTCELCTSADVEDMLKLLNKQEKVVSLQQQMFQTTIQYFVKNPLDPIFELVKQNMLFISKADDESLASIKDHFPKIPEKYKAQYVQYSWDFLEETVDIWEKLSPLKQAFLSNVTAEIIKCLPLEFGMKIIEQHFMTPDGIRDLSNINDFAFNFLNHREEKATIFEKMFALIDKCENENSVISFFRCLYCKVMTSTGKNLTYLDPFVSYFEEKLSPVESFIDFIRIFYMRAKWEYSENESYDFLATKIITYFQELLSNYGSPIISLFAKDMSSQLYYFSRYGTNVVDLFYSMIDRNPVPEMAMLLLEVMCVPADCNEHSTLFFNKILKRIMNINDLGVQIALQSKFKTYLRSDKFRFSAENMEVDNS